MAQNKLYSAYITEEVNTLMDYLIEREEVTQIVFVRRAIREYLKGDKKIDPRITNTKRSDPDFIRRSHMWTGEVDVSQLNALKEIAEIRGCKPAHVFFQVLVDYCGDLLEKDSNIIIKDR